MSPIVMCPSKTCPSRTACFRNEASGTKPAVLAQFYSVFEWDPDTGRCENFVSAERHWMHQAPRPEGTTAAADSYPEHDDPAVQPVTDDERHDD